LAQNSGFRALFQGERVPIVMIAPKKAGYCHEMAVFSRFMQAKVAN
jgi:hypothetical protein